LERGIWSFPKFAFAIAKENGDGSGLGVREDDVREAVVIEVRDSDGVGIATDRNDRGGERGIRGGAGLSGAQGDQGGDHGEAAVRIQSTNTENGHGPFLRRPEEVAVATLLL
jgi:hypothetical protein